MQAQQARGEGQPEIGPRLMMIRAIPEKKTFCEAKWGKREDYKKISSWRLNKGEEGGCGISEPTGPCTLSYQAETPARAHILGEKPKARANAHTLDSHLKKKRKATLESTIIPVLTMWKSEAPSSTPRRAKTRNQHIKYSHRRKKACL